MKNDYSVNKASATDYHSDLSKTKAAERLIYVAFIKAYDASQYGLIANDL